MKTRTLVLTFICSIAFIFNATAQATFTKPLNLSYYYDGYWSTWLGYGGSFSTVHAKGTFDGFCLYYYNNHPSEYFFKFYISNPSNYSEYEIKQIYKSKWDFKGKGWLEYSGIVEYYVTDDYPTIKSQLKAIQQGKLQWGWIGGDYNRKDNKKFGGIAVKRTAQARIVIQPFKLKHNWRCYNIYFDDVAIGLEVTADELR